MKLTEEMIVDSVFHCNNWLGVKDNGSHFDFGMVYFSDRRPYIPAFIIFGNDDTMVGTVIIYNEVLYLYVLPEYRGMGFMSRFFRERPYEWENTEIRASKIELGKDYKDIICHFCDVLGYEPVRRIRKT